MTKSAYLINEKPAHFWEGSSNPVKVHDGYRGDSILAQPSPVYTTARTYRRCFSQFDRNSGCFDGGLGLGREVTGHGRPVSRKPEATFKAAWGTQTRLDGAQVKYQPCSQNYGCVAQRQSGRLLIAEM